MALYRPTKGGSLSWPSWPIWILCCYIKIKNIYVSCVLSMVQVPFSACFIAFQNSMTARLTTRRTADVRRVLGWYPPVSTSARRSNAWIRTVNRTDSASYMHSPCIRCTDRWFFLEFVNNFHRLDLYHCGTAFLMDVCKQSSIYWRRRLWRPVVSV